MPKTGLLIAATAFVLLAATACGGRSATANTAPAISTAGNNTFIPAPPPSSTGPALPGTVHPTPVSPVQKPPTGVPLPVDPPVGSSTVPPGQINASAMNAPPVGVRVAGGDRQVVFDAEQAGCQVISAQVTGEDAVSAHVLVVTTVSNRGNQLCPSLVREVQVTAQLSAPLGNRVIVFQAVTRHG